MDQKKYQQLEAATDEAREHMLRAKATLDQVTLTLNRTKAALKELSPEEQEIIKVNDTSLPELVERSIVAKDEYETWKKRHDMNQKYLTVLGEKLTKSGEKE